MKSATLPDGFFLGQVPPNWTEYLQNGTWSDAHNNRVKDRIPGKHSKGSEVLDKDLPWAIVAQSTSAGNRNGTSTGLSGGEWVIGFYLDENEQLPVIMQVLGKNEVSGAKIKASENGTTQFRDVSRFNSSLVAQAHQITGGPEPDKPAVPSKEDFNAALASTETPPPPPEEFVGFSESEGVTQPTQEEDDFFEVGIAAPLDPSQDAFGNTIEQTPAEAAAQRERIRQKQTVERAIGKMNTGDIQGQAGGVAVNRTPTPDELQQFESKGYRYVPDSDGGGKIVKNVGQNYG